MRLTDDVRRTIRVQIEEALLRWEDFKYLKTNPPSPLLRQAQDRLSAKGGKWAAARDVVPKVPDQLAVYLEILEEVGAVGAYLAGKSAWRDRHEKRAIELFLAGNRIAAVGREMRQHGAGFDVVHRWLYGTEEKDGLVSAMYARFVELNRFCPFCDSLDGRGGQAKGASYPLSGKTCPHRELDEMEEGENG